MEINTAGEDGVGQNGARHFPYDRTENRNMMGHEGPRDPYCSRNETRNQVPQEASAHRQARSRIPDIDMRPEPDTTSQQFRDMASLVSQFQYTTSQQCRDMASLVSQLASEVLLLRSNPTPPATAAGSDSLSPPTPESSSGSRGHPTTNTTGSAY